MEQLASSAERASIKYKQVEYMQDHISEEFDGMISGVTEWGIYVELDENHCEGLVPMRDLADDYYDYDEKNYCIRGRRRGTVYRLGDRVRVRVANANLEKKQLDFLLVDPRLQRPGEDDLGQTVTFRQAVNNVIPHKLEKPGRKKKEDKSRDSKKHDKSSRGEKALTAARSARAKKKAAARKEKREHTKTRQRSRRS